MGKWGHTLGATAAIIDDGRVLLTRRRDLPLGVNGGGHPDAGETVRDVEGAFVTLFDDAGQVDPARPPGRPPCAKPVVLGFK